MRNGARCCGRAVPFVFYTLSIGQQPRYILPVLPPLALLVAHMLVTRIDKSRARAAAGAAASATSRWPSARPAARSA